MCPPLSIKKMIYDRFKIMKQFIKNTFKQEKIYPRDRHLHEMNIMWGQKDMNNQYMNNVTERCGFRGCDSSLLHLSAEMAMLPLLLGFTNAV